MIFYTEGDVEWLPVLMLSVIQIGNKIYKKV